MSLSADDHLHRHHSQQIETCKITLWQQEHVQLHSRADEDLQYHSRRDMPAVTLEPGRGLDLGSNLSTYTRESNKIQEGSQSLQLLRRSARRRLRHLFEITRSISGIGGSEQGLRPTVAQLCMHTP